MSFERDLREEFEKWERIFAVLERSGDRRERASRLRSVWKESVTALRRIYAVAKTTTLVGELEPLRNFLQPEEPRDREFQNDIDRHIEDFLILRARIHNVLTSAEPERAARVEAAFLHLQRLLAVDAGLRHAWMQAWNTATEPALESLGAVHFLHHRLYGFKARSAGAETDSVFGAALGSEFPVDFDEPIRAGTPLVLTEWKKVTGVADTESKLKEARFQLNRYPETAAATLALRRTRFAVLVSEKELNGLGPMTRELEDGSTMRIVNIAIEPSSVSLQAKKA